MLPPRFSACIGQAVKAARWRLLLPQIYFSLGLSIMRAVMSDFEQKVLSDLAELKAHMRWLVGNGNEGKVQELEERVAKHEAYLQRFAGIATAVACLLTFVHFAIDLLKYKR